VRTICIGGDRNGPRFAPLGHDQSVTEHVVEKDELDAAIAARRELGDEGEPALSASRSR
jgi:hypothetical protein